MSLRSPPRFSRARPASRSKKRGGESSPAHWEEWAGLLRLMEALLFVGEAAVAGCRQDGCALAGWEIGG